MNRNSVSLAICAGLLAAVACTGASAQQAAGFANPAGYFSSTLDLNGFDIASLAISSNGEFAVAQSDYTFTGAGKVSVYDKVGNGRKLITTFTAPSGFGLGFFGGMAFKDNNTLIFSENYVAGTVFSGDVSTGAVTALAPKNSVKNAANVAVDPLTGKIYVGNAGGPGNNSVYTVSGGSVNLFASGLGTGYFGGLAFRPTDNALFVGDTNDPSFMGNPGQVLQLDATGSVVNTVSLAGGGGSALSSFIFDNSGDLFATTTTGLSELPAGATSAINFGNFTGPSPMYGFYATDVAFSGGDFSPLGGGSGQLIVNTIGGTNINGLLDVQPTPEPSAIAAMFMGIGGSAAFALRRLKRNRK